MPDTPFAISPHAIGRLALALPFLRLGAFLRAAAPALGCWIVAQLLIAAFVFQNAIPLPPDLRPMLLLAAQFLNLAGLVSLRSMVMNWSRVAFAWPDAPPAFPIWARYPPSGRRFFSGVLDPAGLLIIAAVAVPVVILTLGAILALFYIHPALALAGLYLLPPLGMALLTSLRWPWRTSWWIDEKPLSGSAARAIAKGTLLFRYKAYAWVSAAACWLAITVVFVLPATSVLSTQTRTLMFLFGVLPCLTLAMAWFTGLGALLYARLKSTVTASVFD